jgi:hypothetical protein
MRMRMRGHCAAQPITGALARPSTCAACTRLLRAQGLLLLAFFDSLPQSLHIVIHTSRLNVHYLDKLGLFAAYWAAVSRYPGRPPPLHSTPHRAR